MRSRGPPLVKVSEWHKDIFNWEIEHPGVNLSICAEHFGVGETWLSTIRNTDVYKEYSAQQRLNHNYNVSRSVIEGVEAVAGVALEVIEERIKKERDTIGLGVVNDAANMALKALGFGNKSNGRGGETQVNVILGAATPEALEKARDKMRLINAHREPDSGGAEKSPKEYLGRDAHVITIDEEVHDENADAKPLSAPA